MDLIVGRLSPNLDQAAAAGLQHRGLPYPDHWHSCPENMVSIDIYNLATLNVFHKHVFRLDDLPNTRESIVKTRFRHLPFYIFDIWLPVEFQPTPAPELNDHGFPVPLLSCQGLLRDLEEIKRISSINLGEKPQGYDLMRENRRAFYRSNITLKDESTMVQWIWRGLNDAAQFAMNHTVPLFAAE